MLKLSFIDLLIKIICALSMANNSELASVQLMCSCGLPILLYATESLWFRHGSSETKILKNEKGRFTLSYLINENLWCLFKQQRGFYRPMFEDWLKDIHIIIEQRRYHLLSRLQDSHFIISRLLVLFYDMLRKGSPGTCVLLYAPAVYLCPFFFTVSVFRLSSVAASGGNSLLFY